MTSIMKIFGFLAPILVALALVVSCDEKPGSETPQEVSIVLVETSVSFDATGGSQAVTLKATGDWRVDTAPDWLTFAPSGGFASSDPQSVTVKASENKSSARSADVKFIAGEKTATLKVSQAEGTVVADALKPEATKWYTYKKASKVESGKSYLIVALEKTAVP